MQPSAGQSKAYPPQPRYSLLSGTVISWIFILLTQKYSVDVEWKLVKNIMESNIHTSTLYSHREYMELFFQGINDRVFITLIKLAASFSHISSCLIYFTVASLFILRILVWPVYVDVQMNTIHTPQLFTQFILQHSILKY